VSFFGSFLVAIVCNRTIGFFSIELLFWWRGAVRFKAFLFVCFFLLCGLSTPCASFA